MTHKENRLEMKQIQERQQNMSLEERNYKI